MDAIGIEIAGEFLDLNDASIRLEKINPFFIQDIYQGDYSFPFNFPATDKNIRLLNYINFADVNISSNKFPAYLYLNGIAIGKSILNITKASRLSIQATLNGGVATLTTADTKLADIDLGEDFIIGNTQAQILANAQTATELGDYTVYPFVFPPFAAPNFFNGLNADFCGVINRVDPTNGAILGNNPLSSIKKYSIVPWIFVFYILERIFKAEKLIVGGTFWNNQEMKKLLISNNYALDIRPRNAFTKVKATAAQYFTADLQILQFALAGVGTYDNIAAWDETVSEYTIKQTGQHRFKITIEGNADSSSSWYNLFPKQINAGVFYLVYDNTNITQTADLIYTESYEIYSMTFDLNAGPGDIGKTLYVQHMHSKQTTSSFYVIGGYFSATIDANTLPPVPDTKIKYSNHVPDWTVGEFLREIKNSGVNIDISYEKGIASLDFVSDLLLESNIKDYTGKFDPDYEFNFEGKNTGITISHEFTDEDLVITSLDSNKYLGKFLDEASLPAPSATDEGELAMISYTREIYESKIDPFNAPYWTKKGNYFPTYKIGLGKETLISKLAPIMMCFNTNEGGTGDQNTAIMPYFAGTGSSGLFGLGVNGFTPKMAFWRGVNQVGSSSVTRGGRYVLVTPHINGINNNETGAFEFALDSNKSIIVHSCKKLFNAINDSVILEGNWSPDAMDIYESKNFMKMYVANNMYIVKSTSFAINQKFTKAKTYLLKL